MRQLVISALVLLFGGAAAHAQEARWEGPGGRFSLDFRSSGWTELPQEDAAGTILGIEHNAYQAGGQMRTCFMYEERAPAPYGISQERLNTAAEQVAANPSPEGTPDSITRADISGVTVMDIIYSGPLHDHRRLFYLTDGVSVFQYFISCGASGNAPPEVIANIASMLATLQIHAGAPT